MGLNVVVVQREDYLKDHEFIDKYPSYAKFKSRTIHEHLRQITSSSPEYREFFSNYEIFNENYYTVPQTWILQTNSFIHQTIDMLILRLHQNGIIARFESLFSLPKLPKPEDPGPQILTMKKLSAGFTVWIGSVLIACIAFVCEHIYKYLDDKRKSKTSVKKFKRLEKQAIKAKTKSHKKVFKK